MIYILKSTKTYNKSPENSYGGPTMQFKVGFFLFDTENTDKNYWVRNESNSIEIDSERYNTHKHLIFNNRTKAEIIFMRMKINEMRENGFEFFMPTTFENYVTKYNQSTQKYPEYSI